jgi:hypothetical protein
MNTVRFTVYISTLALAGVTACREPLTERSSEIASTRILAIETEPPEVLPGEQATYRLLAVDSFGELSDFEPKWSYCRTPKPLADNRVVSETCARERELAFSTDGFQVEGSVPEDACERFGPSVQAGQRPRDPDASGGYYQPVRVEVDGVVAIALHRIRCPLANAPIQVATEFRERYQLNRNPDISSLSAFDGDLPIVLDEIPNGRELRLRVGWSAPSVENYAYYDAVQNEIVTRRETLQLSWYATAGELRYDRTASRDAAEPFADNLWRAPRKPGIVHLWVVLRDDRGGLSFASYQLTVR